MGHRVLNCIKLLFLTHISQLSVSQSHLISVLIQMNCFHFPFLRCSRARLLEDFSFAFKHLLYCLSTLGVVISFMLKSALLITEHDLPDHSCPRVARRPCMPTSPEMLVKGRFVGLVILWYMLKFKTAAPKHVRSNACSLLRFTDITISVFKIKFDSFWKSINNVFCTFEWVYKNTCDQLFVLPAAVHYRVHRVSALHIYTKYLLVLVYSYIFIFANTLLFAQRCESQFRPIESFVLNGCELRVIWSLGAYLASITF